MCCTIISIPHGQPALPRTHCTPKHLMVSDNSAQTCVTSTSSAPLRNRHRNGFGSLRCSLWRDPMAGAPKGCLPQCQYGYFLPASTPLSRTIPERVSFEQTSHIKILMLHKVTAFTITFSPFYSSQPKCTIISTHDIDKCTQCCTAK